MRPTALAAALAVLATAAAAEDVGTFAVNEYFGMPYQREPVSFDATLAKPVPAAQIGLRETPCAQVEVVEGTAEAVTKARVWTLVDFDAPGQQRFTVARGAKHGKAADSGLSRRDAGEVGGVKLAVFSNGVFAAKVPVGSKTFAPAASAFAVPGPVVSVSRDGKSWIGCGYLDSMSRVAKVTCTVAEGPVYLESRIAYEFDDGRTYTARVRLYAGKPYVTLVEDFRLGGASRFVFSFDDWAIDEFFRPEDHKVYQWKPVADKNPCDDFIVPEGQKCLARMVVWSQFGYFRGKQETIAVRAGGGDTCVGAFYLRPDRWTRAKVNHVDLYERPEVPGDRMTRGVVGLAGAKNRIAMEAWLVDGHREWAIFAAAADEKTFLAKAHVTEGVWPLRRIARLPLVWNADSSPVPIEATAPKGKVAHGGGINVVLRGMEDRSGLQYFNGSSGHMRGTMGGPDYLKWAKENPSVRAADIDVSDRMAGWAMMAYMAADESAYPGRRAMLPWTDPEALNPFYQGMENMNFNADRYRVVSLLGAGLAVLNQPDGERILLHGQEQMDMALDRYVYPGSGCWEESHNYMEHTIKNMRPLAQLLRAEGRRDFFEDPRLARMFEFWCVAHSPRDPGFGNVRVAPPIGDHGLGVGKFVGVLRDSIGEFARAKNPEVRKIARHMAWLLSEIGGELPGDVQVEPEKPDLRSRHLLGYGAALRAESPGGESYLVLRAGQSWGHHHEDKGSMWFWGRGVHFFGDAAWGAPPGGTYWNQYKQGPASGTQIELVGVTNWTLPCKYAAPFISDDQYAGGYDYANARCLYPFNPKLDLGQASPVALRNGYDRQVLFVHPDLLVVRDNVETVCPTVWRMHSYQPEGTKVEGHRATLTSPQKVVGQLAILYPPGATLVSIDNDDLMGTGKAFGTAPGEDEGRGRKAEFDTRSCVLKWQMPRNTSATWVFGVHGDGEAAPKAECLDTDGRVTRVRLADGREVTVLMNVEPFAFNGAGIEFEGTVGLVVTGGGKTAVHPIRAAKLTAR